MTSSPLDLSGQTAIVTGANTGIGRVTALELARMGAHVFLACRSQERTLPVVEAISTETGNPQVEFLHLDLASLAATRDS
ncbi:MAG: SDR family NAD(P)-dependent oxidoreductase, partial [Planctomycetota bacterium]|nr:SDR family NAD(P)-dependent oxidoreductase [Planctomycetota bacterium]